MLYIRLRVWLVGGDDLQTLRLKAATPDQMVYDGEALRIMVRTVVGDIALLFDHEDFAAILAAGKVRIVGEDRKVLSGHIKGGFVSLRGNEAVLLADSFDETV